MREVHSVVVDAPSERALAAALSVPAAPDLVVRWEDLKDKVGERVNEREERKEQEAQRR